MVARGASRYAELVALIDELRMDRTALTLVKTSTPSDAKEYWKTKTMQERLEALELTGR